MLVVFAPEHWQIGTAAPSVPDHRVLLFWLMGEPEERPEG